MALIKTEKNIKNPFDSQDNLGMSVAKGKTILDFNWARDDGVLGWQWQRTNHTQTICTSLQTDNHANKLSFITNCMEYAAEGSRPRGRRKRTWREVVEKDCQARKFITKFSLARWFS